MSDRTESSVRTQGSSAAADPETAAITPEEPARPSSGGGQSPSGTSTAPGWGGATPGKQAPGKQAPSTTAQPSAKPVGQAPAGPTQPASKSSGKPAQNPGRPAAQQQSGRPAGQRPPAAAPVGATVGAARPGAPQTGARPANRDAAGAPRQSGSRPPSVVAERPEGDRPAGKVRGGGKGPRRARLQLRHIDTWSALKISLVLAIALFFVWMVAVGVLYGVLNGLGVFSTLNDLIGQLGSSSGDSGPSDVITPGIVFGGAAVIGAVNIVLFTALCTVGTFIYNLCSDLVGGLEVTLSERD